MVISLDQLRQQTIPKMEAIFARLDTQQHKLQANIYTPDTYHYPTPTFYRIPLDRRPLNTETLVAKLSKKDAPQAVEAVRGNKLEGYAARWNDASGQPYIDSYGDITVPNSWTESIAYWERERKRIGRAMLMPHLRDHKNQIGGVKYLAEDSQGVIYQSQLSDTPLAKETWALAKDGFLGTSYGYEPTQYDFANMSNRKVRRLLKIMAHEISSVTFPANPYASAIAKSGGRPYTSMDEADQDMQRLMLALKKQKELEASMAQRLEYMKRVLYEGDVWLRSLAPYFENQPTTPKHRREVSDAVARMNDLFNDFDLMLR